ncbi:MAG: DUF2961 domain-containing protein [Planctomycetes bacterium]|nr:DUF2961 domain-containing protein [Planctomycetota bacterium]
MTNGHYPLFAAPNGVATRWATAENPLGQKGKGGAANAGRKGAACIENLAPGDSYTLAEAKGSSGVVRRIWITISDRIPKILRGLRLDFYWDGASRPAVSVPLGDFFGHVLGRMVKFQSALLSSPEARSFNCYIPMPFRKGMKITVTNESDQKLGALYHEISYTLGDPLDDDAMYFHACWRREARTTMQKDFHILPKVEGRGRFLASMLGVIANTELYFQSWWGEGEVKVYLDGDKELPTLCGTGTEDYIGTGWGQGVYDHLYQGCHFAIPEKLWYGFYRQHVPDPIYFAKDIRVVIQQIGCWDPRSKANLYHAETPIYRAGPGLKKVNLSKAAKAKPHGLYERKDDDWSSCAYFYLDRPENDLPALAPPARRIEKL